MRHLRHCGIEELATDERFDTNTKHTENHSILEPILSNIIKQQNSDYWFEVLEGIALTGPINNIEQDFRDPHVKELKMTRKAKHHTLNEINLVRSPINFSAFEHPDQFKYAGPDIGEHSKEILQEFGLSAEEIEALEKKHVI